MRQAFRAEFGASGTGTSLIIKLLYQIMNLDWLKFQLFQILDRKLWTLQGSKMREVPSKPLKFRLIYELINIIYLRYDKSYPETS